MSTTKLTLERPRVVCHLDASATAALVLNAACAHCRQRDAELLLVWVLEPSSFGPTLPYPAGGTGTWGLCGAVAVAVELARKEGVAARAVVRIGDPGRVLEQERRAAGAVRVFTRADVASSGRAVPLRAGSAGVESEAA